MSKWGSAFRIAVSYVVGVYTGNWALFANQIAQEEGRRKRDSNNKRARREFNLAQKDRLDMVDIQPSAPRTLCLGRVRHVEGIRRRWSSGVHKEKATLIVSFAGHEIDGYEQWYLDDLPVALDGSGYVQEISQGTGAGYTTNTTGYAIGATSIGLITGAGTIVSGDTVRFTGDSTYYAVSTGIAAPGTLVLAGTGLQKALAASAVAVEVVKSPYARPTRAQIFEAPATFTGAPLSIPLSETPIAGSVTVTAYSGASEEPMALLVEGTHYSISGTVFQLVNLTSSPNTTPHTISVSFTSGQSIQAVRIRPYLGTDAQNVGSDIAAEYPGFITATDKFAGIACAVVDFTYDPDTFPQSFPSVAPVFRGAKCYDPRLDSTYAGGSGAHRLATPSTWEFTENPALHLQRYITWYSGLNLRAQDYSMADVFSEAAICTTSTDFDLTATAGGTTTVTLPRYRSAITITADTDPRQGLAAILETMAGDYGWAGGVFRFRAGRMGTPSFAIDTSWLVQGVDDGGGPDSEAAISAVQALPREQRVNRVTGRCVDAVQRYQMLPFPEVEDATLIAAKGERPEEIDFAGVSHIAHAQHLGSIKIRQAQAGQRVEVRCGWQALDLELFDVGTLTHARSGMSAKTQEVRGWTWSPGGEPFKVKLAEITTAMFAVENPLTGRDPAPDSTLRRPWQVEQLGPLTVTSGTAELSDTGSVIVRTKVAWPAVVGENVRQGGEIEVQYLDAALTAPDGDWPIWPEQGNSLFTVIPGLQAGNIYLFRARAVQKMPLVRGPWTVVVPHLVAAVRGPVIYRQTTAPSADVQDDDQWFDTDDGNRHYVRSGGAWVDVRDTGIAAALSDAATAQATADGKIDTFWQASAPGSASEGDIWFDTDDGAKQYRWTSGAWVLAADTRIGQAISDAADAQATADGKVVTFVQTSAPTAEGVGDLWLDTDDGNRLYRWSGATWVDVRDTGIASALSNASAAQATADGKIATFYQTSAPTAEGVGDLWFDTDDGNKQYRWSGSAWVVADDTRIGQAISDAAGAQATADGKVATFLATSAPTAEGTGDLWLDTDDGNKLYRWSGSAWVALAVGTGAIAPSAATEITEVSASSISVTGASGTGSNYLVTSRWTPVGTISFTAALTGNVLLAISTGVAFSGAGGIGTNELWCNITLNADFDDDDTEDAGDTLIDDFVVVPQTGTGTVRTAYLAANIPRAVTSGVAYTWNVYAQKLEGTCTISNFYARVEQIKR